MKATITTNKGVMVVELYDETPITTANFVKLVKEGFYNDLTWHRVIPDFVIQGGQVPDSTAHEFELAP